MRWTRAAAVVATIAVTGCAAERDTATIAGCARDARPARLDFTVKDLDGDEILLSAHKGKVILLDFWATWCAPCKIEIPGFIELYMRYRSQGLQVLGFSVDDPVPALKNYAAQMKMNYPILVGGP